MGTYFSTYIGCYLKVPTEIVSVNKQIYKDKFGQQTDNKFDPDTGKENKQETLGKKE